MDTSKKIYEGVTLKCPNCKVGLKINIPTNSEKIKAICCSCQSPIIINVKKKNEPMRRFAIGCPQCHTKLGITAPMDMSDIHITCNSCNNKFIVKIKPKEIKMNDNPQPINTINTPNTSLEQNMNKTATVDLKDRNLSMGRIVIKRMLKSNLIFDLHEGDNTIGRADDELPSDISISKDSTVSRRSIKIIVKKGNNGFTFKLKILNASNPVYVSKKEIKQGEEPFLNYGDEIKLGNTTLKFEKLPHKQ